MKYKTCEYAHNFQQFETIRSFGDNIYTGKTNIHEAQMDQSNLLKNIVKFDYKSTPRSNKDKEEKKIHMHTLCEGRESPLNDFKIGIFPIKATQGKVNK